MAKQVLEGNQETIVMKKFHHNMFYQPLGNELHSNYKDLDMLQHFIVYFRNQLQNSGESNPYHYLTKASFGTSSSTHVNASVKYLNVRPPNETNKNPAPICHGISSL